jgi:hypothetical protein
MPAISGTISKEGTPLGGAYVRLVGPSGEFVAEEYTSDDGAFSFHVVDGTWRLEVRAAHSETSAKDVEVSGSDASIAIEVQPA